jgi:hypothetical protein
VNCNFTWLKDLTPIENQVLINLYQTIALSFLDSHSIKGSYGRASLHNSLATRVDSLIE